MSVWMVTRADIAEIHEALGNHWQAQMYRELDGPAPGLVSSTEVSGAVTEILDGVPEPPDAAQLKHNGSCWQRHSICLAARIYEVLP